MVLPEMLNCVSTLVLKFGSFIVANKEKMVCWSIVFAAPVVGLHKKPPRMVAPAGRL